jgi:tRNA-specific 2-thiouridylase
VSRVLVAMSGGVDSSVAAALLVDAGHEVAGMTLRQWRGPVDGGCCGVDDVEEARRAADRLGIPHYTVDAAEVFEAAVVEPFVHGYRSGRTPNPCATCNREVRWGWLAARARAMGFDAIATGHHARIAPGPDGRPALHRGRDRAKDQSYVLALVPPGAWGRTLLPVGELTKREVRTEATRRGLRNAGRPDSMEICFVGPGRLRSFLSARLPLRPGPVVDREGRRLGTHAGAALYTPGQRRGLGLAAGERRYVLRVDVEANRLVVGGVQDLCTTRVEVDGVVWHGDPPDPGHTVLVQTRAHGEVIAARLESGPAPGPTGDPPAGAGPLVLRLAAARPRPASGQVVALYDGDRLVAGGLAR